MNDQPTPAELDADKLLAELETVLQPIAACKDNIQKAQGRLSIKPGCDPLKFAREERQAKADIEDNQRAIEILESRLPAIYADAEQIHKALKHEQTRNHIEVSTHNRVYGVEEKIEHKEYPQLSKLSQWAEKSANDQRKRNVEEGRNRRSFMGNRF